MNESQLPESTPDPEERGDDRSSSSPRVGAEAFFRRMDRIERALQELARAVPDPQDLTRRLGSASQSQRERLGEVSRELSEAFRGLETTLGSVREDLQKVESALERRLGTLPSDLTDVVGTWVRSTVEGVQERTSGSLDGLRSAITGIEERLTTTLSSTFDATQSRVASSIEALTTPLRDLQATIGEGVRREDVTGLREDVDQMWGRLRRGLAALPTALREALERTSTEVTARLDEVAGDLRVTVERDLEAVRSVPPQLAEGMAAIRDAVAEVAGTEALVDEHLGEVRDAIAGLPEGARRAVEEALAGATETFRADRRADLEKVGAGVTAAMGALGERLGGTVAAVADELERTLGGSVERLEGAVATVTERLDGALGGAVERLQATVGTAAEEAGGALGAVDERIDGLAAEVEALRAETEQRAVALTAGIQRVDHLAEVIETLGRRRGFKELMETEQRLKAEQAALVEQLQATGEGLSQRVQGLEEQLASLAEVAELERLQTGVADRIAEAVDGLRASLAEDLGARVSEGMSAAAKASEERAKAVTAKLQEQVKKAFSSKAAIKDLSEISDAQRDLDKAAAALRADIAEVNKKIESWGKPRSAVRLAREVAGLEERVVDLEKTLQEQLVDEVVDRVQHAFDRRFEALVQVVEARLRETREEEPEAGRRGRRRRARG